MYNAARDLSQFLCVKIRVIEKSQNWDLMYKIRVIEKCSELGSDVCRLATHNMEKNSYSMTVKTEGAPATRASLLPIYLLINIFDWAYKLTICLIIIYALFICIC